MPMGKRSVGSVVIQSRKSLCLRRCGVVLGVAAPGAGLVGGTPSPRRSTASEVCVGRVDGVATQESVVLHRRRVPRASGHHCLSTRSEPAQIWTRDHPSPSLMATSRVDGVKAP
jgi:hypothetical protein